MHGVLLLQLLEIDAADCEDQLTGSATSLGCDRPY